MIHFPIWYLFTMYLTIIARKFVGIQSLDLKHWKQDLMRSMQILSCLIYILFMSEDVQQLWWYYCFQFTYLITSYDSICLQCTCAIYCQLVMSFIIMFKYWYRRQPPQVFPVETSITRVITIVSLCLLTVMITSPYSDKHYLEGLQQQCYGAGQHSQKRQVSSHGGGYQNTSCVEEGAYVH